MKKLLWMLFFVVTFFAVGAGSAFAVVNDTVKVGLKYGSGGLFSANLENAVGRGYEFGYFDAGRSFVSLGETGETTISMTAAGTVYLDDAGNYTQSGGSRVLGPWHVEKSGFASIREAQAAANSYPNAYPAYLSGDCVLRIGSYADRQAAESAAAQFGGQAVSSSATGVLVTRTKSDQILFEFDCRGAVNLGILPKGQGGATETWFKGYKYAGGFEYPRVTGGSLNVINVVPLEDYVKGVVPYEMPGSWPLEALKAQAVCARNFVGRSTKHLNRYGFDVCNTTDCQMYCGRGSGKTAPTSRTNEAVDATAGLRMYYGSELVEAVYHSSDGGATEDAANVWGGDVPYLKGKLDPYESMTQIPNYNYSVHYTMSELTWILQNSNRKIGNVCQVEISERTPNGNVKKVTFTDTAGKKLVVTGDSARTVFYSSTYGKSVRSLRFDLAGGGSTPSDITINHAGNRVNGLNGLSVLSGQGTLSHLKGDQATVITSSGRGQVGGSTSVQSGDGITITGTGNGHNVGMSQYGAKAMAEQGFSYQDILKFYYTDVTIR